MPISIEQIVEETREMPGEVVVELIDRIMAARHGGIEPSVAESWKAETDRRIAEIESGTTAFLISFPFVGHLATPHIPPDATATYLHMSSALASSTACLRIIVSPKGVTIAKGKT